MTLTLTNVSRQLARSEHELITATRAGDDRAFEELYSRYRDRILGFITSRVHDHGRGEDVAQDVFMSALRRLRASDQPVAFKPWIYEIAKNACIDEFRRGTRSREVPLEADGEFVTDRQPAFSVVPPAGSAGSPVAAVESKQRLDDLRGAFGGLSENHHQLLVMREFEGLSYDEIGDRLDMTRQMVESGLFRARRKLSEEYEELDSGRRCEQVQGAIEAGTMQSVRAVGVRERRRVARHLAHCQPCRHVALMAGVDQTLLKPRRVAGKIAAFLPFPLWRWGRGRRRATPRSRSHHLAGGMQNAAGLSEPVAGSFALGPAAAVVAALAVAGGGAGVVVHAMSTPDHGHRAAVVAPALGHHAGARRPTGVSSAASRAASLRGTAGVTTPTSRRSTARTRSPSSAPGVGLAGGTAASAAAASATTSSSAASSSGGASGTVRDPARSASGVGQALAKTVKGTVGAVDNTVSSTGKKVGNTVSSTGKKVGNTVSSTGKKVGNTVSSAGAAVGNTVSSAGAAVGNTVTSTGAAVGNTVTSTGAAVGNTVTSTGKAVGNTVTSAGQAAGTVTTTATGAVSQLPPAVNPTASDAGKVAQGATSTVGAASSTPAGILTPAGKTVTDATQPVQSLVGGL